jgi:two-component system, OmpR family, alkaline phosphatase synthesis response regulator PhoP
MSLLVTKKKILVVDDDAVIRFLVSDAFHICKTGCAVRTARNGAEAVQVLQSVPVDFILTDLEMPVMNGYKFLSYVKRNHPDIPFLVMTGATTIEEERMCAFGITQYIAKPFNVLDLVQRVMSSFDNGHFSLTVSQKHYNIFANAYSS